MKLNTQVWAPNLSLRGKRCRVSAHSRGMWFWLILVSLQVTFTTSLLKIDCSPTSWRCWFNCLPTQSPKSPFSLSGHYSSGRSTRQTPIMASTSGGSLSSPLGPFSSTLQWCERHSKHHSFSAARRSSVHLCPARWHPEQ